MAYYHHGSIRKYTAALLDFFNSTEIQYEMTTGGKKTKQIPLKYSSMEKSRVFDEYTSEQILSGNYSVLPRASLSLSSMGKNEGRVQNKNNKIGKFSSDITMEYMYNSVPYEFSFEMVFQCRGMNEASQIIEQIAPKFNPTINIDVWDASNLDEPTRVPVLLNDVQMEQEEYNELSSNIITITFSLSLQGNLYPPIKSQPKVKEFKIYLNQIQSNTEATRKEMIEWDVDLQGSVIDESLEIYSDELTSEGSCEPKRVHTSDTEILSIPKTLISDNKIILPMVAFGDVIGGFAMIYSKLSDPYFIEATCEVSENGMEVLFDPLDDLNDKYCVLSYLTYTKPKI
mgnify:CR=1 FL=1